jgi:hypothetical protein
MAGLAQNVVAQALSRFLEDEMSENSLLGEADRFAPSRGTCDPSLFRFMIKGAALNSAKHFSLIVILTWHSGVMGGNEIDKRNGSDLLKKIYLI